MKLTRLVVENFGPFLGRQEVDLTVSAGAPVIVVYGENERGKTSLANAIRWCLYKIVLERGGAPMPTVRLMNTDALAGGVFNMSVTLEFDHEGVPYVLERHVQAHTAPTQDRDLEFHVSLRKGGNFEPTASIDRTIRDILPPQISRFFLFDGEMLNDYEDLLRDPNRSNQVVRQSIEQILGLPSIQRALPVLETLRRAAERRQLNEARARRQNERLIADTQQKEEELDAIERDIGNHQELQTRLGQERDQARSRIEQFGEVRADLRQLDRYESELRTLQEEMAERKNAIRLTLKESWWAPLEATLEREAAAAQAGAEQASQFQSRIAELRQLARNIEATVADATCRLCHHQLSSNEIADLRSRLNQTRDELSRAETSVESPASYFGRLNQLRPFIGRGILNSLRENEAALRRLKMRERAINSEIEAIRERVRTDYRTEIGVAERQLEHALRQLADVERLLADAQLRQRDVAAALQRLQNQIRSLPTANRHLAAEAAVYGALHSLFESAASVFRERLRQEVERAASEIHQSLTADPGYRGLRINDQYGLSLVKEGGRIVPYRSAGSEQLVALSLIGALNRSATREGPIVMDTPFGRLDRRHRSNILRFAAHFGPQVVLLVQSGEFERDRDLADLGNHVSHEYRIERDGASDRSRVVPLQAVRNA